MLEELRYFIRESGARSAAINGISMMPKLFVDSLAFNQPWLNSLEWIPQMTPFPLRCQMSLVLGRNPFWHLVSVEMETTCVWMTKELRHCVNLVSGNQLIFRMWVLWHYCGINIHYHGYWNFMPMTFEEIKYSYRRNISKTVTKQQI